MTTILFRIRSRSCRRFANRSWCSYIPCWRPHAGMAPQVPSQAIHSERRLCNSTVISSLWRPSATSTSRVSRDPYRTVRIRSPKFIFFKDVWIASHFNGVSLHKSIFSCLQKPKQMLAIHGGRVFAVSKNTTSNHLTKVL